MLTHSILKMLKGVLRMCYTTKRAGMGICLKHKNVMSHEYREFV